MKKLLITTSLLALTACGGGSTDTTEKQVTSDIKIDSVISGDIAFSDNGSDSFTGKVSLTESDSFIAQSNTKTSLGIFNITSDGEWKFEPSRSAISFIELTKDQTVNETINVKTADGLSNIITITLIGVNDLPEFGTGNAIDSTNFYTNTADSVTGTLSISDPDKNESSFIVQQATQGDFGLFSITDSGQWTYTYTDESLNYYSTQDIFTVTSIDGSVHPITVFITPTAEIDAESLTPVTGTLNRPQTANDTSFVAQTNTQGVFGIFSIDTTGQWSYSMTNLASDFVDPKELFTVQTPEGNNYQVAILVKGLYQRLVSVYEYTLNTPVDGSDNSYHVVPFSVDSLYDTDYVVNAKELANEITTYHYNSIGDNDSIATIEATKSESVPTVVVNYEYEYTDSSLSKVIKETLEYDINSEQAILTDLRDTILTISDNKLTGFDAKKYEYDNTGDSDYVSHYTGRNVHNDLGKKSEAYTTYLGTESVPVDEDKKDEQLRHKLYYLDNGNLDFVQGYRVSSTKTYQGLRYEDDYFYNEKGRISYQQQSSASYDINESGVYVYGEINYDNPWTNVYNFIDEIDVLVTYSPDEPVYDEYTGQHTLTTDRASIYQYEDTDSCSAYDIIDIKTSSSVIPSCRIKTEDNSSLLEDIPLELRETPLEI